jgi:hypothetical protein
MIRKILVATLLIANAASAHAELPAPDRQSYSVHPVGWVRKADGYRRFLEAYLEVPRKNAKSTLAAGIGLLALLGAAHQDSKKRRLMGATWERYERETSYWPLGAQMSGKQPWSALWPGVVPVVGGAVLWAGLTFVHPVLMKAPVVPPWGFSQ